MEDKKEHRADWNRIQALTNLRFLRLVSSKKAQLRIQVLKNLKRFFVPKFSTKGQLRIQEMAFMLLAVFLFFTLVGLFALTLVYTNVNDAASQIAEDKTLSSLNSLADTPEMSCVATKPNCVDGDRLVNLIGKDIYSNFWPYSSLYVIKYSGFGKDQDELIVCTKANYPECDVFYIYDKEVENERAISTFVSLCRKELENGDSYNKCETAKMIGGTRLINIE